MAGLRPMDEQDQASTHCTLMGTTRNKETKQAKGFRENSREGDEGSRQDLACSTPRCLEKICWSRMFLRDEET